jgi:hypothetical protein
MQMKLFRIINVDFDIIYQGLNNFPYLADTEEKMGV